MPNRLAHESSPYLRQHADNPVDWYAWGDEALARAKAEDKPILLSVGYSACHWCHVMAHECFENPAIARQMNEGFVNIKVDREERPDVDEVFQRVTQMVTGQGGWPLTVFLDPQLRPIYGGTYFPPDDRYGRPSLPRVMTAILDAFQNRRTEADTSAGDFVARMRGFDAGAPAGAIPARDLLAAAAAKLRENFDGQNGGFGTAPKFPMVADQELLLAQARTGTDPESLAVVLFTLRKMAAGGIYDQLDGGFHRYSVDPQWLAPHFEKMLYDNALLPRLYLEAYRLTGEAAYARVVHETLGYLLREMQGPEGAFYSAQDADSEGVEGKFFVWTANEIEAVLGAEHARLFGAVYDVTPGGNWEGHTILRAVRDISEAAIDGGLEPEEARRRLDADRSALLAVRERRVKPGLDDKRITAWNGLVLTTLARAGGLLEHPPYLDAARRLADFLIGTLWNGETGRLQRIYHHGGPKIDGFLDDYAYTAAGLLDLHRATGESRWAEAALPLLETVLARFGNGTGALFLTPNDAEALPARPRSTYDQMLPSPAGVALHTFWRAYVLTDDPRFRSAVEAGLAAYGPEMARHPTAFGGLLAALDLYYRGATTCVLAGSAQDSAARALAQTARRLLAPDDAVLLTDPPGIGAHLTTGKRSPDGSPAAFVCQGFACSPPARTAEELTQLLAGF